METPDQSPARGAYVPPHLRAAARGAATAPPVDQLLPAAQLAPALLAAAAMGADLPTAWEEWGPMMILAGAGPGAARRAAGDDSSSDGDGAYSTLGSIATADVAIRPTAHYGQRAAQRSVEDGEARATRKHPIWAAPQGGRWAFVGNRLVIIAAGPGRDDAYITAYRSPTRGIWRPAGGGDCGMLCATWDDIFAAAFLDRGAVRLALGRDRAGGAGTASAEARFTYDVACVELALGGGDGPAGAPPRSLQHVKLPLSAVIAHFPPHRRDLPARCLSWDGAELQQEGQQRPSPDAGREVMLAVRAALEAAATLEGRAKLRAAFPGPLTGVWASAAALAPGGVVKGHDARLLLLHSPGDDDASEGGALLAAEVTFTDGDTFLQLGPGSVDVDGAGGLVVQLRLFLLLGGGSAQSSQQWRATFSQRGDVDTLLRGGGDGVAYARMGAADGPPLEARAPPARQHAREAEAAAQQLPAGTVRAWRALAVQLDIWTAAAAGATSVLLALPTAQRFTYRRTLNAPQPGGDLPPLILAAKNGALDAVKALLALGADVSVKRAGKASTALAFAVVHDHWEVVEHLILVAGAPLDACTRERATPEALQRLEELAAQSALARGEQAPPARTLRW
jgi:hypothetical protein